MAQILLGTSTVSTNGNLPAVGSDAPDFLLVDNNMKEVSLRDFAGLTVVLNIFPSIDTRVCATSVREFNKRAAARRDVVVLAVAKDLPYAMKRFCAAEGIDRVVTLSDFRNKGFTDHYGVEMLDGAMAGLMARAIVVIDKQGKVKHAELVPAIGQEPDYEAAFNAI